MATQIVFDEKDDYANDKFEETTEKTLLNHGKGSERIKEAESLFEIENISGTKDVNNSIATLAHKTYEKSFLSQTLIPSDSKPLSQLSKPQSQTGHRTRIINES
jgi:hypothetical protein